MRARILVVAGVFSAMSAALLAQAPAPAQGRGAETAPATRLGAVARRRLRVRDGRDGQAARRAMSPRTRSTSTIPPAGRRCSMARR